MLVVITPDAALLLCCFQDVGHASGCRSMKARDGLSLISLCLSSNTVWSEGPWDGEGRIELMEKINDDDDVASVALR